MMESTCASISSSTTTASSACARSTGRRRFQALWGNAGALSLVEVVEVVAASPTRHPLKMPPLSPNSCAVPRR